MLTKRQLVVMLLAFLPLMAGAQERRFTIKEAEKLVPRVGKTAKINKTEA